MSVHSWSGTVACLLVLCLRAGCAASQQQQQPAALLGVTADEFLSFILPALQAELQPILSSLEAGVEDLDRRLEAREDLDGKLEARLENLDRKLEQQPAALLGVTADEFLSFISRAVRAELQPILSSLEARVEDLDRRLEAREDLDGKLEARMWDLDKKLETQEDAPESKLMLLDSRLGVLDKRMFILDSRMDELTVQLWNSTQQSLPNDISRRFGSQQVRLDEMSSTLANQTSRFETLFTSQESQESQLDDMQSRVDGLANSTTGVQSRVDGAANGTAGQQPQADEVTSRPDQAEDIDQPRDCSEMPPGTTSGVYPVWPDRSQDPVQAFCQEDSDGGNMWTVFQRRDNIQPRQDFYQGWDAYKRGFGSLTGEFWLGLEHLHKLTAEADRPYQLKIDLEAFDGLQVYDGDRRHALYSTFRVSTEEEDYMLSVSGYTGDAGNGLEYSNSSRFSTRDRDNDGSDSYNCAEGAQGAWWYSSCGYSSLNGRYLEDGRRAPNGIWWSRWRYTESLKKVQMMLRPA